MRKIIKQWHQGFSKTPRQADMHLSMLVRLLNYAVDQGETADHCAGNIKHLHSSNRADIIWLPEEIEALLKAASMPARLLLEFAVHSGLRRTDLVNIPATADKGDYLQWWSSKSNKRNEIIIPVTPELRAVINNAKAYRRTRTTKSATLLCNSRGRPYTPDGFSTMFDKARGKTGINKNLHDLRGTAVTNYIRAGFTDQEIGEFVGWKLENVQSIRRIYVTRSEVMTAAINRLKQNRP
ncbi:tyrosine-type recombinase/integrase [Pseudovibrio sp. Ad37]|uniref:tyrosine-type recombinase/integrase n=1 Tax=Pseudovibrio sp. Ad37 TaxID=989422 RepID=UPI0007AE8D62|nr:tyrosine-type recombinase/integrase [Pseudovibrio sp. Ad37]